MNLLWVKLPMERGYKARSRCWWIDVRETAISFLDYLELSFSPCENRCVMIKLCTVILWWLCNLVAPTNIIYCTIRLTANYRNHRHLCFPCIDCWILIRCPVPSPYVTSLHYFTKVQVQYVVRLLVLLLCLRGHPDTAKSPTWFCSLWNPPFWFTSKKKSSMLIVTLARACGVLAFSGSQPPFARTISTSHWTREGNLCKATPPTDRTCLA